MRIVCLDHKGLNLINQRDGIVIKARKSTVGWYWIGPTGTISRKQDFATPVAALEAGAAEYGLTIDYETLPAAFENYKSRNPAYLEI